MDTKAVKLAVMLRQRKDKIQQGKTSGNQRKSSSPNVVRPFLRRQ